MKAQVRPLSTGTDSVSTHGDLTAQKKLREEKIKEVKGSVVRLRARARGAA